MFNLKAINTISPIVPQLYLSSAQMEHEIKDLRSIGITHILQVGKELRASHPGEFQYLQLPVVDAAEQDLLPWLQHAFDFIDQGREAGTVLVHCQKGQTRSPAVTVAYLMWKQHKPYEEALEFVKAVRPIINTKAYFSKQLQDFGCAGCILPHVPAQLPTAELKVWPPDVLAPLAIN